MLRIFDAHMVFSNRFAEKPEKIVGQQGSMCEGGSPVSDDGRGLKRALLAAQQAEGLGFARQR